MKGKANKTLAEQLAERKAERSNIYGSLENSLTKDLKRGHKALHDMTIEYKRTIRKANKRIRHQEEEIQSLHDQCASLAESTSTDSRVMERLRKERAEADIECDKYKDQLYNLLAVLNEDGGHYREEHGTEAAIENGLRLYYDVLKSGDKV